MRKLIILFVTLATITSCDLKRENFNSSKKHFTNEVLLGYTPVKDQGHSSLCWAYAMLATIETEHIQMGDSVNLSVDYIARYHLGEQARFHFLSKGYDRMTLRGTAPLLLRLIDEYGIMPYDSYNAHNINYQSMMKRLVMLSNSSRNMSELKTAPSDSSTTASEHYPRRCTCSEQNTHRSSSHTACVCEAST